MLRRAAAGAWQRVGPVLAIVSPFGWCLAGAAGLLAVVGTAYGWQEAKAAALLASILFASAIAFVLGRASYEVTLDLARTRVAVGDTAVGGLEVANAAPRPAAPALLELPVGAGSAVFELPRLRPREAHEELFSIPTARRAVIVVGPASSVRTDPLGILRRRVVWTDPQDLYVHPRTVALGSPAAGFIRDLEGMPTAEISNSDVSFHALRDYAAGDDRRHIHWKTTARTGILMVRQFEETRRAHLAIALSANLDEYEAEEDFELAVSCAGSIGRQALLEQRELSALTQRGPLRTETARHFLDDLTRLEGASLRSTTADAARSAADSVPNASVVFLVTGGRVAPAQLRVAAAAIPWGIRALAVRCEAGAAPGRASIGDLDVLTVGSLDGLGAVLRKAKA
ncbi:DUF58 domain-containing protein [Sinomonas sp. JGH33]|uniref:DUF58 domain-containing protein n=1 Tax=Sinomonas terricola TaxID=3110330 RepID=A0ABU5T4W0_9MICC|nr:DUF58 domain-containing protein [Sinomonas sp. JGH33]MEA5454699.1 DUF58 domain-containing protein [Sinomonas sp. JGH33]